MSGPGGRPGYVTGTVTSGDGTVVGFRQLGRGPGVILLHGGMQAAQNLMRLAGALADAFTVYVPDRRGRGLSGPPGERYGIDAECADVAALARATGAASVFGLSSGAIIALQAGLAQSPVRRVAVYEPPLSVNRSTPSGWVARYDREVTAGRLGSAAITALRGARIAPPLLRLVPRVLLEVPLNQAVRAGAGTGPGDVPMRELVPTMRLDIRLVIETEGRLPAYSAIPAEVLLLGGSRSPAYLKTALDALAGVLPGASRVELAGCGHLAPDNRGKPERVARELRTFFTPG